MRYVALCVVDVTAVASQRQSAQSALALRRLPHGAAGGGDSEEVHVAARLGGEVDGLAVRGPGRILRVEAPGGREVTDRPPGGGGQAHVLPLATALRADEPDGLPVRRPIGRPALGQ